MKKLFLLIIIVSIVLTGCGANTSPAVKVGSKDFTESLIISEIYALALEDAGIPVERKQNIAGSLVHQAITSGEIDLYPEYTGTGLLTILKMKNSNNDPKIVYDIVKEAYKKEFNLIWLIPSSINDTNGIAIRTDVSKRLDIKTLSDLQKKASQLRMASQGEFELREDGLPGLEKIYGPFSFKSIKAYDNGLKFEILRQNEADVAPAYSTEGQLADHDAFTYLVDDKHFFPPYYLAPVVREETLKQYPKIEEILNRVDKKLDTETIIKLNAMVDIDKKEYTTVAKDFYNSIK